LEPGDLVALFTDGFFEWSNGREEAFGIDRLKERIRHHQALPSAEIIGAIHRDVLEFAEGTPQLDDLTAVVIKKV
jgi:serine phosphatase RsbU (regulator of sigma subunit)